MQREKVTIVASSWLGNQGYLANYYQENRIIIDSLVENKIKDASHYQFLVGNQCIGFFAISETTTIVAFQVFSLYGHLSQELFARIRQYELVSKALVITGDEFLLSHAIDSFSKMEKQGYFSLYTDKIKVEQVKPLTLVTADLKKHSHLLAEGEEFLKNKIARIQQGDEQLTIYLVYHGTNFIGFGNIEQSVLTKFGSTGMLVLPEARHKGYGKSILWHLNKIVTNQDREPISGCYYFNHHSKKSMEAAGGYSTSRILNFYF